MMTSLSSFRCRTSNRFNWGPLDIGLQSDRHSKCFYRKSSGHWKTIGCNRLGKWRKCRIVGLKGNWPIERPIFFGIMSMRVSHSIAGSKGMSNSRSELRLFIRSTQRPAK